MQKVYYRRKYNLKRAKYFAYAVYDMDILVKRMFKEYRGRSGIESSHKMNAARTITSSKKPVPVLLYAGLGFVLMNIYVYIQWTYLCIIRRGGQKPVPWTFKNMIIQITRKIEDEFEFVD